MRQVALCFGVSEMGPAQVYEMLEDFSRIPQYSAAVRSLEVTVVEPGRTISAWEVNFREGILRWKEEDVFCPELHTVRFRQLEGDAEHFSGEWSVSASGAGSRIHFQSSFDMGFPELNDIIEPIAEQALLDNIRSIIGGLIPTAFELSSSNDTQGRQRGQLMHWLAPEREALEEYLPGLDAALSRIPLMELEAPENAGIRLYRECAGPSFLIPSAYRGRNASALDAIRVQRALGSRSPSLAIASTMHQFSVMTLVELNRQRRGPEGLLLEGIATRNLLVASGFAEGRSGVGILAATMRAQRTPTGFVVNGSKKPCSLSRSMDLLTASATVEDESGQIGFAVLLIPARSPGLQRRRFWNNPVLGGAESDEVILTDVSVSDRLAFVSEAGEELGGVQLRGFLWFELLITASYLGIASALVERVLASGCGREADRTALGIELEGAMAALEAVARQMTVGTGDPSMLARMLFVRYAVQAAIARASALAVELLGGIEFICTSDVGYLHSACCALAFHPPSRISMHEGLSRYLIIGKLDL